MLGTHLLQFRPSFSTQSARWVFTETLKASFTAYTV